ncbi:ABC transporter ATP-binding protein [Kosmotoga olearia]|uniref:ABC transporter related n=1 Tax=Kosmotoga olearia (strain ATCC BAA-1733 / DSM 21960 / TBF 19.5.1) TaxID=521045 RepID=C5CI81_KOSOT|nr:ABC transporter ATP-binding protein [Kosmotoga olearia]ACR80783.1 ABC transporter related [Kosmotoga olearia TBF 19.5.1]
MARDMYTEVDERSKVRDWHVILRLWKYAKPYWYLLLIGVVMIIISTGFDLVLPYLQKVAIDNFMNVKHHYKIVEYNNGQPKFVEDPDGKFILKQLEDGTVIITDGEIKYHISSEELRELRARDLVGISKLALYMLLILLGMFFTSYLQVYVTSYMGQKVTHDIRKALFRHVMRLPMRFFDTNPSGRIATRIANDTKNIAEFFSSVITSIIKDVVLLVGIIIVMLKLSLYLGLISLAVLPLIAFAILIFRYFDRIAYRKVRTRLAAINAFLAEHISGMAVIQLFNQEKRKAKEFDEVNKKHYKSLREQLLIFSIFRPLMDVVYYLALTVLIWFGAKGIIQHTLEFGVLYAFVSYIDMFFRPLKDIAEKYDIVQNALASSEKIFKLMDTPEETYNDEREPVRKISGEIEFDNVSFAYDGENYVLKNISFRVSPKEKIAIVGETGAGKTSIISLLNGLYRIQNGDIRIDGTSIYDLNLQSLRRRIGVVLQDVFLFSGTILDNIRLFNEEIPRQKVIEAAKYVYAERFIERLSKGYDTEILERGGTLSAGERQLIALARAVLYNAEILVLDEATANIDAETEMLIQQAMEKISNEKTVLTIAHRISTIRNSDRILVIHKGKLVEVGSHDELIKLGGIYADLYRLQYELDDAG